MGKKINYKNRIGVNNKPNHYDDDSHPLTECNNEYANNKNYIDHKFKKEINK